MKNLSDGKTDGIVLFYLKDKKLYPIALTKEQVDMLDITISMGMGRKLNVIDKPLKGLELENLCDRKNR